MAVGIGEGVGSHSPKMAPGWMPGSSSLAVNKPYLEVLDGSDALPPSVAYPESPGGMSWLGYESTIKGLLGVGEVEADVQGSWINCLKKSRGCVFLLARVDRRVVQWGGGVTEVMKKELRRRHSSEGHPLNGALFQALALHLAEGQSSLDTCHRVGNCEHLWMVEI